MESSYDGRHLLDFDDKQTEEFAKEFLSLEYVGFDNIYEKIRHSNGSPLRIYLDDGTSFRISYWFEKNAINPGAFGTETMKGIMENVIKKKNEMDKPIV
ncbi:MAG TPA: hypothetical protein GX497_09170 [Bacillus bacterium]|nr:hypothetical protein [Bacillus sp. (in: firmicutes)]